jgi:hypothetical protein
MEGERLLAGGGNFWGQIYNFFNFFENFVNFSTKKTFDEFLMVFPVLLMPSKKILIQIFKEIKFYNFLIRS